MNTLRTFIVVMSLTVTGCNSVEPRTKPDADIAALPAVLAVDDAIAHAAILDGKEVTVQGRFMGWKGRCSGMPPTRSAWMLEGEHECIYVAGPVPEGISPAPSTNDLGRATSLHGTLVRDNAGRPYLMVH
jgi:hypothetical protein